MEELVAEAFAGVSSVNETKAGKLEELYRLTELGRLSSYLLHEISNPLTAAILHLDQSKTTLNDIRHARRSMRVLQRYVEAARRQINQENSSTYFHIRPQISDIRRILIPLARQAGVRLRVGNVVNCRLYGDSVKLQQIIANLVINAVDSYEGLEEGHYDKTVELMFKNNGQWLVITVKDYGSGISQSDLPRIFEPFFTTKNRRGGLGVGLAMIKRHVEGDFNGSVAVTSSPGDGTYFRVKLPLSSGYSREKPNKKR